MYDDDECHTRMKGNHSIRLYRGIICKKNAHYKQKLTLGDIIVFRSMFGDLSSPFPEIDAFVFD